MHGQFFAECILQLQCTRLRMQRCNVVNKWHDQLVSSFAANVVIERICSRNCHCGATCFMHSQLPNIYRMVSPCQA